MKSSLKIMLPALLVGFTFIAPSLLADDDKDAEAGKILGGVFDRMKLSDRADSLRYKNPNPTAKDTADFVTIYRQLADEGLPWATYEMGGVYLFGWSVQADTVEAANWYIKSAEMGDTRGMRSAGIVHLLGIGRTQDIPTGLSWLDKAATAGNTQAASYLGEQYLLGDKYVPRNDSLAIKYLYMASDSGHFRSQESIYSIYTDFESRYYNDSTAFRWAEYLAKKDDPFYITQLGIYFRDGIAVEQDYTTAGKYFYQAAQKGFAEAESQLAILYYYGSGAPVNYVQSYAWATQALTHGDTATASIVIDTLNAHMSQAQKDSAATAEPNWHVPTASEVGKKRLEQRREQARSKTMGEPADSTRDTTQTTTRRRPR